MQYLDQSSSTRLSRRELSMKRAAKNVIFFCQVDRKLLGNGLLLSKQKKRKSEVVRRPLKSGKNTSIHLRRAFSSASVDRLSMSSASVAARIFPNLSCLILSRAASRGGVQQASYDKHSHQNCFHKRPMQAFPKKQTFLEVRGQWMRSNQYICSSWPKMLAPAWTDLRWINFRKGVPRAGLVCTAGDQIWSAVIRRDLAANACSYNLHTQAQGRARAAEIGDRQQSDSNTDMYACAPLPISVTTQIGGRPLDVLPASRRFGRGSKLSSTKLLLPFQEAERRTGGHPKIALDPLCLKDATLCLFSHLNLGLSGFAHHKSDFGWSTFGCVHWSVVGEVAPPVPPGPGWK